jgi:redox-sensitive bicupin YhaK (pirin superfamily)
MSVHSPGATRSLARVIPAAATLEGGGFLVHRPLPTRSVEQVDPFLLLDEMGPLEHAPGEAQGAPDHPHQGFELITYLLAGEMEHLDSHGNHGTLRPGDAQYMLGGAGLVHSEMPSEAFLRSGGRRHGFQIWVNLSRTDKALAPRYKDVRVSDIPVAHPAEGVTARVLAGEVFGVQGPVHTATPWSYVHVTLAPGARAVQPVPDGWTATTYVFESIVGSDECGPGRVDDEYCERDGARGWRDPPTILALGRPKAARTDADPQRIAHEAVISESLRLNTPPPIAIARPCSVCQPPYRQPPSATSALRAVAMKVAA